MRDGATPWDIHAGKTGDVELLFKKTDVVVALGWHGTSQVTLLSNDREAFKSIARSEER